MEFCGNSLCVFKAGVRDFCLPLLAVRVITKTLSTRAYVIGSAVAYSGATVAAVKRWINCFQRHTTPAKRLISLSEFDPFGPITVGKSRRTT